MNFSAFDTSKATLQRLYDKHELRYRTRLIAAKKGHPFCNADECLKLLALWEGIKARDFNVKALTPAEASELYDALADEGL